MSYDMAGARASGEQACRYGMSKLYFRGPQRDLSAPYVACVGGTETFGRFVADPFPALLENRAGRTCVNLGSINSGLDAILRDPELMALAARAGTCVLQLPGAHSLSNRFYRVHPRRNDRFLEASPALKTLYPEVDFTDFHFTRHLLTRLIAISPERFVRVRSELQQAWIARMRSAIADIGDRVVLLWLRYPEDEAGDRRTGFGSDPLWVTGKMVSALTEKAAATVELRVSGAGASDELEDMIFGTLQEPAAEHLIGPATHRIIADRVYSALQDLE